MKLQNRPYFWGFCIHWGRKLGKNTTDWNRVLRSVVWAITLCWGEDIKIICFSFSYLYLIPSQVKMIFFNEILLFKTFPTKCIKCPPSMKEDDWEKPLSSWPVSVAWVSQVPWKVLCYFFVKERCSQTSGMKPSIYYVVKFILYGVTFYIFYF